MRASTRPASGPKWNPTAPVAGVNRLLPVKRQVREQRLARHAGFDDVLGSQRVQDRRGRDAGWLAAKANATPRKAPQDKRLEWVGLSPPSD
jgi:hypothetical protein